MQKSKLLILHILLSFFIKFSCSKCKFVNIIKVILLIKICNNKRNMVYSTMGIKNGIIT